jgi:hypothetical protein
VLILLKNEDLCELRVGCDLDAEGRGFSSFGEGCPSFFFKYIIFFYSIGLKLSPIIMSFIAKSYFLSILFIHTLYPLQNLAHKPNALILGFPEWPIAT